MHSDSLAEWILRRCTSRERAASVIGDLIELRPQKGLLWFWLSLAGAVVRLLWRPARPALAFAAAFYVTSWVLSIFLMTLWGMHSHHHIPDGDLAAFLFRILSMTSASLWLILVFSALRYNTLDPSTQLAAALTAGATGLVFLWWQPVALVLLLAFLIVLLAASLFSPIRRNALITTLTAVLVFWSGSVLSLYLAAVWQKFLNAGPWGDQELHQHPSAGWLVFCLMLTTVWVTTATYSALRNYFASKQSQADRASVDAPTPL